MHEKGWWNGNAGNAYLLFLDSVALLQYKCQLTFHLQIQWSLLHPSLSSSERWPSPISLSPVKYGGIFFVKYHLISWTDSRHPKWTHLVIGLWWMSNQSQTLLHHCMHAVLFWFLWLADIKLLDQSQVSPFGMTRVRFGDARVPFSQENWHLKRAFH